MCYLSVEFVFRVQSEAHFPVTKASCYAKPWGTVCAMPSALGKEVTATAARWPNMRLYEPFCFCQCARKQSHRAHVAAAFLH